MARQCETYSTNNTCPRPHGTSSRVTQPTVPCHAAGCHELGGRLDQDAGHTCAKGATPQQGIRALLLGNTLEDLTHPKGGLDGLNYDRDGEEK